MTKYLVQAIDGNKETRTGKKYHKVDLMSVEGEEQKGVAIWQGFPNFDTITIDSELEGSVVTKMNGQYVNKTLYPPKPPSAPRAGLSRGNQAAVREGVREAQENKEVSIKLASTYRMAVDVVVARGITDMGQDLLEEEIKNWRKYFWETWDEPVDKEWPNVK